MAQRRTRASRTRPALPNEPPRWLPPLLLVVAAVVPFAGSLTGGFVFDDHALLLAIHGGWWELLDQRALRIVTLLVDRALFGSAAWGYHAHNLFWHALCVVLLYAFVARLARDRWLAFAAALLFAVHPIHVEAVVNPANRKESLCLAFSLLACLAYLRFLAGEPRRWGWLAASAAAGLLAFEGKQVAAALPLALLAYEVCLVPRERRFLATPRMLAVLLVGGAGLVAAAASLAGLPSLELGDVPTLSGYEGEPSAWAIALTSARAFWIYAGLLVWPAGLCPDHLVRLSESLLDPATAAAWIGLAAVVAGAVFAAHRAPLLGFGLLWLLAFYLPVSNLIPISYIVADRYMYVPSAGFCIALAWGARAAARAVSTDALRRVRLPAAAAGAAAVAGLAAVSLSYTAQWRSGDTLWSYTLDACNPRSARALVGLANGAAQRGDAHRAVELFGRALDQRSDLAGAHFGRGNVRFALGDLEGAVADYDAAIERDPDHALALYNRGRMHFDLGLWHAALADFDRALELRPELAEAYNNRAMALERVGRFEDARRDWRRAIELKPHLVPALMNLAFSYQRKGDERRALPLYRQAAAFGSQLARQEIRNIERNQSLLVATPEQARAALRQLRNLEAKPIETPATPGAEDS